MEENRLKKEVINIVRSLTNAHTFNGNWDDLNSRILYNPEPEWLIQIIFPIDDKFYITIESFHVIPFCKQFDAKIIFSGEIPDTKDHDDLDFDFIRQILKNYKSFK